MFLQHRLQHSVSARWETSTVCLYLWWSFPPVITSRVDEDKTSWETWKSMKHAPSCSSAPRASLSSVAGSSSFMLQRSFKGTIQHSPPSSPVRWRQTSASSQDGDESGLFFCLCWVWTNSCSVHIISGYFSFEGNLKWEDEMTHTGVSTDYLIGS